MVNIRKILENFHNFLPIVNENLKLSSYSFFVTVGDFRVSDIRPIYERIQPIRENCRIFSDSIQVFTLCHYRLNAHQKDMMTSYIPVLQNV